VRLAGYPAPVADLRERIKAADALLVSSPEFNRGMSGVLKNAIDWVSRPPEPPFHGKLACVMTAATGALAGALANYDMRQVLSSCGVLVLPGKEIMVGGAKTKFDDAGNLTDEAARSFIAAHLVTFAGQIRLMR
jgi:chromate reductase